MARIVARRPEPLHVLSLYAACAQERKHGAIADTHRTLTDQGYDVSREWVRLIVSGKPQQITADVPPPPVASVAQVAPLELPLPTLEVDVSDVCRGELPPLAVCQLPEPDRALWYRPDAPQRTITPATALWLWAALITACVLASRSPGLIAAAALPLGGVWWCVSGMMREERTHG
jgi:hypothetical protein